MNSGETRDDESDSYGGDDDKSEIVNSGTILGRRFF